MVWTVIACSNQVEKLKQQNFETAATTLVIKRLVQTAKDVNVFAGLIKYKLPGRVWEILSVGVQDLGAFQ